MIDDGGRELMLHLVKVGMLLRMDTGKAEKEKSREETP